MALVLIQTHFSLWRRQAGSFFFSSLQTYLIKMFSAERPRPVCPLNLPEQPVFVLGNVWVRYSARGSIIQRRMKRNLAGWRVYIIFDRHIGWKAGSLEREQRDEMRANGSMAAAKLKSGGREWASKWNWSGKGKEQKAGANRGLGRERTETDRRAGNFCYSSQRACSVETQTQSREKKRGTAGKSLRRQLFCTSITYGVCILFAALFTH